MAIDHFSESEAPNRCCQPLIYSRSSLSPKKEQGFVLIAVLGMIMLLTLIASFVSGYAEQRLNQTLELRTRWQQQLDQEATLATLQFIGATEERTHGGFALSSDELLRLDSQAYLGLGQAVFALQDEGSLLSLLEPDRDRWQRLLYKEGLSASQAEQFLDQLQDYTDQDDLRRLNGASRQDYQQTGLEPPTQRFMISPGQVFNLLNGEQWQPLLHKTLPLITARSGQLNNLNTAPEAVLATLPGTDENLWPQLVAEREQGPYQDLSDANRRLGMILPLDPLAVATYPSTFMRIQLWPNKDDCRQVTWIGLTLTPSSNRAPWEIDYVFNYQHTQACQPPAVLAAATLAR
ncbi:MAG: hypothetical protein WBH20_11560 [Oceanisphaera sp.]|uniref:general secretion pathway protein GspK n=1 Tax=Oceanisphaera sp. TaxID=1929979 RepID=UPI003C755121